MIKSERLKKGDTVGFVSPCNKSTHETIDSAAENFRLLGYKVKYAENLFSETNTYAASVEERAADFNSMISDPEVKMIIFTGGEIGNELLPYIDYENIKRNPKILLSYSDGTTILNAVNYMTGLVTFYGSSPRFFKRTPSDYTLLNLRKRLESIDTDYVKNSEWRVITPGKARGILVGGYLVNYASLIGLDWYQRMPDEDYILFIEDHEKFSSPMVVSKWFATLEHRGVFDRARGLIFGHYSLEESPLIDEILKRIGNKYSIPVVRTEDFGHGENGAIYPISVPAEFDTSGMIFRLLDSGVK